MSTARVRTFISPRGSAGLAYFSGGASASNSPYASRVVISDVIGNPKGDNPFFLSRKKLLRIGRINGSRKYLSYDIIYRNAVPDCVHDGSIIPPATPFMGLTKALNSKIQDGNPGSSDFSLPNFLFELKDVPGMLKHAGRRARDLSKSLGHPPVRQVPSLMRREKRLAEDWLNYNFGWVPFFSDLSEIAGLADNLAKTHNMLRKATERSGYISRKAELGSELHMDTQPNFHYESFVLSPWYATATTATETKQWAVTKWKSEPYPYKSISDDKSRRALRLALGADLSFENVWNALPWSWLVDYFTDLSDIINIRSNRFGIGYDSTCLMTHVKAIRVVHPKPDPQGYRKAGPSAGLHETKKREVLSLSNLPSSGLSLLSGRQLGNLAALSVAKIR